MASYLSVLIQAAEPANYKLNYDEHYLISVPIATATTPGIAAFDDDYFVINNGVVEISPEYEGNLITIIAELEDVTTELANKVDKITPANNGYYAYVVYRSGANIVNTSVRISVDADDDTIVMRTNNGRIRAESGIGSTDVVNKGQLVEATTNIPKSALASDVRTSLGKADTAYQKPDTGIPETDLSTDIRTKLNKAISRVGISPEAWEVLPDADKDINTMYFVGPYGTAPNQYFVEWMYFVDTNEQGHWEAVGSTQSVDFSNYYDKTDIDNMLSDYAKQNGYYRTMRVGVADQIYTDREIEDADEACPPIVFGTAGGEAEVQSGLMPFEEVRGNTIKWNQLVQNGNFTNTDNWSTAGTSLSVSNNVGTIANTNGYSYARAQTIVPRISGHKYFVSIAAKDNTGTGNKLLVNWYQSGDSGSTDVLVYETLSSSWQLFSTIVSSSHTSDNSRINIYPNDDNSATVGDAVDVKNVMIIDLTDIYGAGKEPTTVAEFVRDYPMPYYPYNAGTPISSKSSSVDFVKRNQWDEETEAGTYDNSTGEPVSSANNIRSKATNYIDIFGGETYYLSCSSENGTIYPFFYDADYTFISTRSGVSPNSTFTTPLNARYMRFHIYSGYGKTYNHNICIYINWNTPGLPYVPYSKQHITLPNLELRSAGSAYDVLYQQGGGKRRIGTKIFAADEDWSLVSSTSGRTDFRLPISGIYNYSVNTDVPNIVIAGFETVSMQASWSPGICTMRTDVQGYVYISLVPDASVSDAQSAMAGKTLLFELATETDITLEENPGWTEYAEIDNFGTVKFNQDPAQTVPVPQSYFVRYTVNLVEFLDSAYVRADGDPNNLATQSDLSGKLDKMTGSTTYKKAYVKNADGTQGDVDVSTNAVGNAVVQRNGDSQVIVPVTPTANTHAASKEYVDDAVGQLIYKHEITLSFTVSSRSFVLDIVLSNDDNTAYTSVNGRYLFSYIRAGAYSITTSSYVDSKFWSVAVCPSDKYIHTDTGIGFILEAGSDGTTIYVDGIDPDYNTNITGVTVTDVVTTW